ncbi:MAG: ATP-dependent protease ATPase subunit HslU [Candidatus Zixiibacteriota bacterium]
MDEYWELSPRRIVKELSRYIIGQDDAKRAVAIAVRNRWRRSQVEGDISDDIIPDNILLVGPTGVGKTEIARRLANLTNAPFIKVEASKFTEVGYVGRDVESIARDLLDTAVYMVRSEMADQVEEKAKKRAIERVLDHLIPPVDKDQKEKMKATREKYFKLIEQGKLDEKSVEIETSESSFPMVEVFSPGGMEEVGFNFREMFEDMLPRKKKKREVKIEEALRIFTAEEIDSLLDMDEIIEIAKERTEQSGLVFVDEIDKLIGSDGDHGPNVSRSGVQRDLLPLVEGCNVPTKHGIISTEHILFIAAGAFHTGKPSDLIPEFQGRFPIRAELDSLSEDDFHRILTEPENALTKQYQALLMTEEIDLNFTRGALKELAKIAYEVNMSTENIGARRLQTVMSNLLGDLMFEAPDIAPEAVKITKRDVEKKFSQIIEDKDLSRFIL